MWLRVEAEGLTYPQASFGMSINSGAWDGSDCSTGGGHWDVNNGEHAHPSEAYSHTGDLPMLQTDDYYHGSLFTRVDKP